MKQKKDYTLHLLFGIAILAGLLNVPACYNGGQNKAANELQPYNIATDTNAFYVGDTLLPDYAHCDSLIVIDAGMLNYLFDGVDLPAPATDSEIDSVLHLYCCPISGHVCRWVTCPYKNIVPEQWNKKVSDYIGNSESVSYSLDMLHLAQPTWEYEKLEDAVLND